MGQPVRWLLAGALAAETLPVIQRVRRPRLLHRHLVEGRIGDVQVAVLRCGVGPDKAERRTREAVASWKPTHVVSFGTCGSLVDRLGVGSVVAGAPLGDLPVARCVTVRRAVATLSERTRLAEQGFDVCEMEASGVRLAAGDRPFHLVKVVSDLAGGGGMDLSKPGPLQVLRFKALAARLVDERLAPELVRVLEAYASSSV